MEDDLKKKGRRPKKNKNGRRPQKKIIGRRPQKKMKIEDYLNFFSFRKATSKK